jgi:hypothetical protein
MLNHQSRRALQLPGCSLISNAWLHCQPTRAGKPGRTGCGEALRALVTLEGAHTVRNAARRALHNIRHQQRVLSQ